MSATKRGKTTPQPRADDDIIFGELSFIEEPNLPSIEELNLPPPPTDIAQELARLTGKRGATELDDTQFGKLLKYGRVMARHERKNQTVFVLCDDIGQPLVVIQSMSAPHFAFFPN